MPDSTDTIEQTFELRSGLNTAMRFSFVKTVPLPTVSDPDPDEASTSADANGDWIEHERMRRDTQRMWDRAFQRARAEVRQEERNKLSVTHPELYRLFRSRGLWEDEG